MIDVSGHGLDQNYTFDLEGNILSSKFCAVYAIYMYDTYGNIVSSTSSVNGVLDVTFNRAIEYSSDKMSSLSEHIKTYYEGLIERNIDTTCSFSYTSIGDRLSGDCSSDFTRYKIVDEETVIDQHYIVNQNLEKIYSNDDFENLITQTVTDTQVHDDGRSSDPTVTETSFEYLPDSSHRIKSTMIVRNSSRVISSIVCDYNDSRW